VGNAAGLLVLALGLGLWFAPESYARLNGVRGVTPGALRRELGGRPGEYAKGHIPGARHLPLDRLADGAALLENLKGSRVVCVCATGKRSAVAAVRLKKAGFPNVYNLSGGMFLWGRHDVETG